MLKREKEWISETRERMEKAIELVIEAQDIVDSIVEKELKNFRVGDEYHAYGKFGFNQLLGNGNPYDTGLDALVEKIQKEGL